MPLFARCAFLLSALALSAPMSAAAPALDPIIDLALREDHTRVLGHAAGDRLGKALALGDLDGDGFADLVLGAPEANRETSSLFSDVGEVNVILAVTALPATVDLSLTPGPEDVLVLGNEDLQALMGGALAATGDLNGDGFDDLAIGAPQRDPEGRNQAGEVLIVFGRDPLPHTVDTLLNQQSVRILGARLGDRAGSALAMGDVDADGFDDLLIGVPQADRTPNDNAGEVIVIFGRATWPSQIDLLTATGVTEILGAAPGDMLGTAVAAGDVDGDGFDDLLLGAPGVNQPNPLRNDAGEADLVRGRADLPRVPTVIDMAVAGQADLRLLGRFTGNRTGQAVALGDIDGDGHADLAVGAPMTDQDGGDIDAGEAYIWLGRAPLPATVDLAQDQEDVRILGHQLNDLAGDPLVLGDLDGDGHDDLLMGIAASDPSFPVRSTAGEVDVLLSSALLASSTIDLETTAPSIQIIGDRPSDRWGAALAVGDSNRDGFTDMLVGGPEADPGLSPDLRFQAGEAALILGGSAGPTASRARFDRAGDAPPGDLGPVLRTIVDFPAGDASQTTATLHRVLPAGPGLPPHLAPVFWEIHTDRTAWPSATVTLRFTDAEIAGLDEPNLRLYQAASAAGPWTPLSTTIAERANRASTTVSALGFFALGESRLSESVVDFLLGLRPTPPDGAQANGDGVIDIADVVTLLNLGQ